MAPGLTNTPGSRTVNSDADFNAAVEHQALKRRLTPEGTAAAVAFLASDAGVAMTGQILCADGGLILRLPGARLGQQTIARARRS